MNRATLAIGAAVLIGLGAAAGYWVAGYSPGTSRSSPAASHLPPATSKDRQVLYWHDPMHPQQKFLPSWYMLLFRHSYQLLLVPGPVLLLIRSHHHTPALHSMLLQLLSRSAPSYH